MGFVFAFLVGSFYLPCPTSAKDHLFCAVVWLDIESQSIITDPKEFIVDVVRKYTNLCLGIIEKLDKEVLVNLMGKKLQVLK